MPADGRSDRGAGAEAIDGDGDGAGSTQHSADHADSLGGPRAGGQDAPLTPDQERLLALGQAGLSAASQHLALAIALRGELDLPRLRLALEAVAAEHDALRARLQGGPGGGARTLSFSPRRTFEDLSPRAIAPGSRTAALDELARRPIDLSLSCSRVALLGEGPRDQVLCLVLHRLAFDAASLPVLERALVGAYAAAATSSRRPPAVAEPGALASWLNGRARQRSDPTWPGVIDAQARLLSGDGLGLELPADHPRPALFSGRGAVRSHAFDAGTVARLRGVSAARRVALDDLALTALLAWLKRWASVDDPPIGIAMRAAVDGADRVGRGVGPFTGSAVLRLAIDPATPCGEAAQRVAVARRALDGGPIVDRQELVQRLALPDDPSRTPLYQVAFEVEPPGALPASVAGVSFERVDFRPPGASTDLTLRLCPAGDTLRLELEHAADLFDGARAEAMLAGLVAALEALPGMCEAPIGRLPVMSPVERARTLAAVTTRPYDPQRHAFRQFEAQAARTPDATAALFRGETISYGRLNRLANRLAHRLIARGVVRDSLVGIYCERSLDLLVAVLGIAKAGGAYLPLDPSHPSPRTQAILEDAAPQILLTQAALAGRAPVDARTPLLLVDGDGDGDPDNPDGPDNSDNPNLTVDPDALAYVIFTSGSTGRPKGVAVAHRSFTNFLASMAREPGFGPGDRILSVTTLSFDIAGLELFLPLAVGGSVEIADGETCVDGARLAARLRDPAVTVIQATPATFRLLLERGWPGKPRLKVLCGGETLQPDLIEALLGRVGEVWNMYGPTETTVWSTVRRLAAPGAPVSIGWPIDNTSAYVLGPLHEPVPFGAVGEIYLGGDGVARGYRGRPELTAQRFFPDPFSQRPGARMYQTGDIGRFLPDGSLTCLGRADFQVKIRGFRVETAEIEEAVLALPDVAQTVVTAWEPQPGDKRLVAYVVWRPVEREFSPVWLRAQLARRLPAHMVPSFIVRLDEVPRNAIGKVDRRSLPPPTPDAQEAGEAQAPPSDDFEAQIHESFGAVLGLRRVGVDESFFDLGGESIMAARLARALELSLGLAIPVNLLFESPTIRGLAARLRDSSSASASPRVVVLRRGEGERRLFCVCGIALYSHLARALPGDLSVLGVLVPEETSLFDVANLRRGRAALPSVEELASLYVEAIRQEQPDGPYRLVGVSFGGVLAYEVARQLAGRGERIAFLGLLDALLPQALRAGHLRRVWWRLNRLVRDRARLRASLKLYGARLAGDMVFDWSGDDLVALRDAIHEMAVARYSMKMGSFDGSALLISARDRSEYRGIHVDPAAGWDRAVRGGLTSFDVPGHHLGILQPPNVSELASKMAPHLTS